MSMGKSGCCEVPSMCGYSLRNGATIVSISTMLISTIAMISSITSISYMASRDIDYKDHPEATVNLLFALFSSSISLYQFIISALFLWKILKAHYLLFYCNLWYASHVSITILYSLFYLLRSLTCFGQKLYVNGALTAMIGILHTGTFTYFCIVVNSYYYYIDQLVMFADNTT